MTNKVMVDFCVLIEYIKNSKTKLLDGLLDKADTDCFINEVVVSEYLYYFLALNGGKSPRSIQSAGQINAVFQSSDDYIFLHKFSFLHNNDSLFLPVPELMAKYNLLPNNAIILATCKLHNIPNLASHHTDFEEFCKREGITLLTE